MLYLDYAKPLYNGKYILNFFADSADDLEQISHGESFITKNGINYGSPQPGSTVTITMPNSNKTVYSLDASNKWIITNTISVSEINVNPDTEATEQLNKLEINGTVYNVLSDKDINTLHVSEVLGVGWIYEGDDGSKKYYIWADGDGERWECSFDEFYNEGPEYVFLEKYGRFFKFIGRNDDALRLKGEHEYVYVSSSEISDFPSTIFVYIEGDYWSLQNYYGEDIPSAVSVDLLGIPFLYGLDVVVVDQLTGFSTKAALNLSDDSNPCIYWVWKNIYYEIRFTDDEFTYSLYDIGTYANVETTSETAALTSLEVAGTAYKIDSGTKVTPNVETTSETAALTSLEVGGTAYKIGSGTKDGIIWKGKLVYNSDTHVLESITISTSVTSITYEEFKQAIFGWAAGEIPYIRIVDGAERSRTVYDVINMNDYTNTGVGAFRAFVLTTGRFDDTSLIDVKLVPVIWTN